MQTMFIIWLSNELKERGLTHQQFADLAGVSRPAVSNVLRGAIPASADFVLACARALQVEPVSLLRLAGHVAEEEAPEASDPLAGMIATIRELPPDKLEIVRAFVEFVTFLD